MVQIQEASRSELVLRMLRAAVRDHGPATFVIGSAAEDLLIAHVILGERLDIELVTLDPAHAAGLREALADCCDTSRTHIRRANALDGALFGKHAWITSRRSAPGDAVADYDYDARHGVLRFNPLAQWTTAQVGEYLGSHGVALTKVAANASQAHVRVQHRAAA